MEDLQTFLVNTQRQLQRCIKEREKLYKRISRCTNREDLPELVKKRDELTDLIRQIRKDSGAGQKIKVYFTVDKLVDPDVPNPPEGGGDGVADKY